MQVFRKSELIEVPWKNGGGVTRNIASAAQGDRLLWRLSMADVSEAGPFSSFAGLTRILTVIEGDGMILHGPQGDLHADYAVPVTFDGATEIMAELTKGPLRDFNLMFDTELCHGTAQIQTGPTKDTPLGGPQETTVLHCIKGQLHVAGQNLAAGDTIVAEHAAVTYTQPTGSLALEITLRRLD